MRVLITGAAGLYGYHVVRELGLWDHVTKVYGLDDFSRGFPPEEEFTTRPWGDKVQIIKQRFQECTTKEINDMNLDLVIHLAGYNSGKESTNTPEEYFLNNEYGAFQFVQTLQRTRNKPRLIYTSTVEVYGLPLRSPIDESHPTNPLNPYAVTKLAAEKHIMAAGTWLNYPVTTLRFCNTYGENQNICGYTPVICSFIDRALRNEPLIIYGSGEQARDFLYVKDAVRAICLTAARPSPVEGKVINIATGRLTTIRELADKILRLTESTSETIYLPSEREEIEGTPVDIELASRLLNWRPKFKLEDGILNTIRWYKGLHCI